MPPRPGSAGVPFSGPGAPRPSARRAPRLGSARATAFRLGAGPPNREGSPSPEFGDPAVHSPSPEVGDPRCPPCQVGAWGPKGDRARWVHGPIGDHRARCADGPEAAPPGAGPGGSKLLCQGEPVGVLEAGLEQGERLTAMERLRQRRKSLVVLPWVVRRWASTRGAGSTRSGSG